MTNFDSLTQTPDIQQTQPIHCKRVLKSRWKPTKAEVAYLKSYFKKNPYPSKDQKQEITRDLRQNFNSKVEINQLSRWFQNQRERTLNPRVKSINKNVYKKFSQEQLDFLNNTFNKNSYPKIEEMETIAKQMDVSLSKIENWFKHNRRTLVKQGCFTLKAKKYFTQGEISYLDDIFKEDCSPNGKKLIEISKKLFCNKLQIKNWFTNKRKKLKLLCSRSETESHCDKMQEKKEDIPTSPEVDKCHDIVSEPCQPERFSDHSPQEENPQDCPYESSDLEPSFSNLQTQSYDYCLESSSAPMLDSSTRSPIEIPKCNHNGGGFINFESQPANHIRLTPPPPHVGLGYWDAPSYSVNPLTHRPIQEQISWSFLTNDLLTTNRSVPVVRNQISHPGYFLYSPKPAISVNRDFFTTQNYFPSSSIHDLANRMPFLMNTGNPANSFKKRFLNPESHMIQYYKTSSIPYVYGFGSNNFC